MYVLLYLKYQRMQTRQQENTDSTTPSSSNPNHGFYKIAKYLAYMMVPLLILTLFRTLVANSFPNLLNQALEYIARLPPSLAASLFLLIYIFSTVFLLPASVLTLGAGYIFGIPRGLALVSLSSTTAATVAFLLARLLGRNLILDKILSDQYKHKFNVFSSAITHSDGGAKIVLLTRLSPVFPFGILNYTFGITDATLSSYVFASWLGMLPGSLLFVYFGSIISDIALISHGAVAAAHHSVSSLLSSSASSPSQTFLHSILSQKNPFEWALLLMGLLSTILVTKLIARAASDVLKQHMDLEQSSRAGGSRINTNHATRNAPRRSPNHDHQD